MDLNGSHCYLCGINVTKHVKKRSKNKSKHLYWNKTTKTIQSISKTEPTPPHTHTCAELKWPQNRASKNPCKFISIVCYAFHILDHCTLITTTNLQLLAESKQWCRTPITKRENTTRGWRWWWWGGVLGVSFNTLPKKLFSYANNIENLNAEIMVMMLLV